MDILKTCEKRREGFPCVTLTGMPGSGKSTVGKELAKLLNWSFMDTDALLEALYATRLQDITDAFGKERFLEVEGILVTSLEASRCVIATGGSVIYSPAAIKHLLKMGPLVYLEISLAEMENRIRMNPERGIAISPSQTLRDLYEERVKLYEKSASCTINTEENEAPEAAAKIAAFLDDYLNETGK